MKHAQDMSRDELLALPIYDDESGSIDVDGGNVFMPPAAVKENLPEAVEDDTGVKWRVSMIEDRWMRYRSIATPKKHDSEKADENFEETEPSEQPS